MDYDSNFMIFGKKFLKSPIIFQILKRFSDLFCIFAIRKSSIMEKENKNLNRIKVVLAEKNLQNKWLAEQIGRDQATVSKWVTNSAQPNLETLIKIAQVLKVDLNELVRFEEVSSES